MDFRQQIRKNWKSRRGLDGTRAAAVAVGRSKVFSKVEGSGDPPVLPPRRLRQEIFARLVREIEGQGSEGLRDPNEVRHRVGELLERELGRYDPPVLTPQEITALEDTVIAEMFGLGPLDELISDPTVSDVLVNGHKNVWVDRFGKLERTSVRFDNEAHLMRLLGRLASAHGRHLDEASPLVDVRLADGSRLHAIIPPLCAEPIVSIRRMRIVPFRLRDLIAGGTLDGAIAEFLKAAVAGRLNIAVSGGGASGKTTFLNVLSRFIPHEERVVTIEETAELKFEHPHVISIEARLPNIEGRGEISLRSLVKNSLRMRADRIIVGEVRGAEVFDMLQAMNTGHEGSLTTVHANSPEDALRRLENLVVIAGLDIPSVAIREFLGAAFDLIIHLNRFHDGVRRVMSIREVIYEDERLKTRELFRFEPDRSDPEQISAGRHVATGIRPTFLSKLTTAGFSVESLFTPHVVAEKIDPAASTAPRTPIMETDRNMGD